MSLDHPANFVKQQSVTRDAFLGGRVIVSQPAKGFRAGLNSVLLGASVGAGASSLLDLGAGVGTAALVAMTHNPELAGTLVEADPQAAALGRDNLAANGLAARATVLELDITQRGAERLAAGLKADCFDTVIANPPYFEAGTGTAPSPLRAAARHTGGAALDLWVKAAATSAAPLGEVIFIHTAQSLPSLLAAFESRFGAVTILPLSPRPGQPASRILVRAIKGSRAPLTLLTSRALHEAEGRAFRPEFDAIFLGLDRLHW